MWKCRLEENATRLPRCNLLTFVKEKRDFFIVMICEICQLKRNDWDLDLQG
jgi:hypothetical protein